MKQTKLKLNSFDDLDISCKLQNSIEFMERIDFTISDTTKSFVTIFFLDIIANETLKSFVKNNNSGFYLKRYLIMKQYDKDFIKNYIELVIRDANLQTLKPAWEYLQDYFELND